MSYYIEVEQSFDLKCSDCPWTATAKTAGKAEQEARNHIEPTDEEEERGGGSPRYSHVVKISPVTLVGRDL